MSGLEIIGLIIMALISMLSIVGGVGGGLLFIPVLILLYNYTTTQAVALSNGIVLFNCLSRVITAIIEKNPDPEFRYTPIINFNLTIIFGPMLCFGNHLGVIFSQIFPDYLLLAILEIVLLVSCIMVFLQAIKFYKSESRHIKCDRLDIHPGDNFSHGVHDNGLDRELLDLDRKNNDSEQNKMGALELPNLEIANLSKINSIELYLQ